MILRSLILGCAGAFGAVVYTAVDPRSPLLSRRTLGYAFIWFAVGLLFESIFDPLMHLSSYYPVHDDATNHDKQIVWQSALLSLGAFIGSATMDVVFYRWQVAIARGAQDALVREFRQALYRSLWHGFLVSFTTFLWTWTDPSISWRSLISICLIPGITVIGTRFLGESWYDSARNLKKP